VHPKPVSHEEELPVSPPTAVFRSSLVAGLLALSACHDSAGPPEPGAGPRPSPAPGVAFHEPQGEQAALARAVPGFGGLFLDETGAPTVYLTDPGQGLAAQRAIIGIAREHGFAASALRVRKGEFSYAQLDSWFGRATPHVLAERGVVYADLDEASNRVTIGVESAEAGGRARSLLKRLGVPDRAILIRATRPVEFAATLQNRVRPVGGGLQINFGNFLCTLGFNALRSGVASYITNSHCTNVQGGTEGTKHYQQDRFHANTLIGTEAADPTYFTGGACPANRRCRFSDASRGRYAAGVSQTLGRIARTTSRGSLTGSLTISTTNPAFTVNSERANSLVGQTVNKIGRTTGWTFGKVIGTCVTTNVSGTNITQLCQTFVNAGVGAGDSGSPVFNWSGSGSTVRLAGVLWGGAGNSQFVFSPMSGIEKELGALTTF
jgi:hypothetical protein